MNRSTKRYLITLFLFLLFAFMFVFVAGNEVVDPSGGWSALTMLIIFPLFVFSLFWSIINGHKDRKLKQAGVPVEKELFPAIGKTAKAVKDDYEEGQSLPDDLKKRRIKFRLMGSGLVILSILCYSLAFWTLFDSIIFPETLTIGVATLLLIAGVTLYLMSSPGAYNNTVDGVDMLICPPGFDIDRIYEDFKNYKTVYGSVYKGLSLGKFPSLFWGGIKQSNIFYMYKPADESFFYTGFGMGSIGVEKTTDPLYTEEDVTEENFGDALCFNLSCLNFQQDLTNVIANYFKTGVVAPMPKYNEGHVYFFEEFFKLTGQRFTIFDINKQPVLSVEGTFPLITLKIFDRFDNEIFKVKKEIVNAMPHYLFYDGEQIIGEFVQDVSAVRDSFSMRTNDGLYEMREITTMLGRNYLVTLDEKPIGNIAERLNLTLENIIFDNMVMSVYDEKNLPLFTAFAVMAAREIARDETADMMSD